MPALVKALRDPGGEMQVTAGAALVGGDVVVIGTGTAAFLGIVADDSAASGEPVTVFTQGHFRFPKAAGGGVTFAAGAEVEWDVATSLAVAVGGAGDADAGRALAAAVDGQAYVDVWLNKGFVTDAIE